MIGAMGRAKQPAQLAKRLRAALVAPPTVAPQGDTVDQLRMKLDFLAEQFGWKKRTKATPH